VNLSLVNNHFSYYFLKEHSKKFVLFLRRGSSKLRCVQFWAKFWIKKKKMWWDWLLRPWAGTENLRMPPNNTNRSWYCAHPSWTLRRPRNAQEGAGDAPVWSDQFGRAWTRLCRPAGDALIAWVAPECPRPQAQDQSSFKAWRHWCGGGGVYLCYKSHRHGVNHDGYVVPLCLWCKHLVGMYMSKLSFTPPS
jgi:hypothetical protein